jgi:hypothetical protein
MNKLMHGAFTANFFADGSDSDALYGSGPINRWVINIYFKDPEELYINPEDENGFLIKAKLFDGSLTEAFEWAKNYLKTTS